MSRPKARVCARTARMLSRKWRASSAHAFRCTCSALLFVRRHLSVAAADPGLRRRRHHDRPARPCRPFPGPHRRTGQRQRAAASRSNTAPPKPQAISSEASSQARSPTSALCCSGRCATTATRLPTIGAQALEAAVARLGMILRRVGLSTKDADVLRGAEGEAAQVYFAVFGDLIRIPDAGIRLPRPIAPATARSDQRASIVSLHSADS